MKIGTIQALACIGLGTLLGFVAATRGLNSTSRAEAATSQEAKSHEATTPKACCDEGSTKVALLAQAEAETVRPSPNLAAK
jgi:hypothetical protein